MTALIVSAAIGALIGFSVACRIQECRIAVLLHQLACLQAYNASLTNVMSAFDDKPEPFSVEWRESRIPQPSRN